MNLANFIAEFLSWAAFEAWCRMPAPRPVTGPVAEFIRFGAPVWTWCEIREEYARRIRAHAVSS